MLYEGHNQLCRSAYATRQLPFKGNSLVKSKHKDNTRVRCDAVSHTLCASRNPNFSNFTLKTLQNLVKARTQLQVDRHILHWDCRSDYYEAARSAHLANDGLAVLEDYMQPAQQIRPNGCLSANFSRSSPAFKVAGRRNL